MKPRQGCAKIRRQGKKKTHDQERHHPSGRVEGIDCLGRAFGKIVFLIRVLFAVDHYCGGSPFIFYSWLCSLFALNGGGISGYSGNHTPSNNLAPPPSTNRPAARLVSHMNMLSSKRSNKLRRKPTTMNEKPAEMNIDQKVAVVEGVSSLKNRLIPA